MRPVELDEHLETLRVQARFSARTLRTASDLLEQLAETDAIEPAHIDRVRSQLTAALSAARTSKTLAAQAAVLIQASTDEGVTADGHQHREHTRVG